jgi:hypothetical protein
MDRKTRIVDIIFTLTDCIGFTNQNMVTLNYIWPINCRDDGDGARRNMLNNV